LYHEKTTTSFLFHDECYPGVVWGYFSSYLNSLFNITTNMPAHRPIVENQNNATNSKMTLKTVLLLVEEPAVAFPKAISFFTFAHSKNPLLPWL